MKSILQQKGARADEILARSSAGYLRRRVIDNLRLLRTLPASDYPREPPKLNHSSLNGEFRASGGSLVF
jgi:hypothetical protein